jgi:SAM-dependent methyltransferase
MSETARADLPSDFVVRWSAKLAGDARPPKRALDVAMGRGRHTAALASAGYLVFGVDLRLEAVRDAVRRAATTHVDLLAWVADLTRPALPTGRFELIVVARYLDRRLFPAIRDALSPGGVVVYETFTERQRELGRGPTSPDHLLKPGELRSLFGGFDVLFYEEVAAEEAVARIVARRG